VSGRRAGLGRAFAAGLGGVIAAGVIALPWILHVHAAGGGFDITPPDIKYRYIWDHIQIMDAQANGISQWEAAKRLEGSGGVVERYIESQGPAWHTLTSDQRYQRLVELGYRTLLSYPPGVIARALAQSVGQFLLGGGAGNYYNLLGLEPERLSRIWMAETTGRPLETLRRLFADAPTGVFVIAGAAFGFVLVMRLAGLVGLAMLGTRRQWPLLLLLVGVIAYFALVYVFAGSARYRLIVEPALLMAAVLGMRDIASWLRRRKVATA
jgi:hypothetical protein